MQQDTLEINKQEVRWITGLSAHSSAGIISIPQTEPIKSLKLLIPLLTSAFYLTHRIKEV